jgi:hypothetical protein
VPDLPLIARPGFGRKRRQDGGPPAERLARLRRRAGRERSGHDRRQTEAEGAEADYPELGRFAHRYSPLTECNNVT